MWSDLFDKPVVCLTSDQDWTPPWAAEMLLNAASSRDIPLHVFRTNRCPVFDAAPDITHGWHPNFFPGSSHGETVADVIDTMQKLVPGATTVRSHCFYEHSKAWEHLAAAGIRVDSQGVTQYQPGLQPLLHPSGIVRCPVFFEDDTFFIHATPALSLTPVLANLDSPGLKILNVHATFFACNTPSPDHYASVRDRVFGSKQPADGVIHDGRGTRTVVEELLDAILGAGYAVGSFATVAARIRSHIDADPGRFPRPFGTA